MRLDALHVQMLDGIIAMVHGIPAEEDAPVTAMVTDGGDGR